MARLTLYLYRHAKVDGHRGDVPLAADADAAIDLAAAELLARLRPADRVAFLATRTRRSSDTAKGIRARLLASDMGLTQDEVRPEHAIRNPDLYLAGHRVEMVSTGAAMAAQLPQGLMTGAQVEATRFYAGFFTARDRIEFWLRHQNPPGENAAAVARRIVTFCSSLGDADLDHDLHIAAVSHSPVMRAVLVHFMALADPGEPEWVEPIEITLASTGGHIRFRDQTRPLTI